MPSDLTESWVVSAAEAASLIAAGDVTVLDTRPARAFAKGHVPRAVRVDWTQFSQSGDPHRGKLLPATALGAALRAVGVSPDRPVVVVGAPPHDWGEDGRVVWMLRTAGHRQAALVNGGHAALRRAGVEMTRDVSAPAPGSFEVQWALQHLAVRDDLLPRTVRTSGAVVIDTREPREFRGATPYGESRGGHVPDARSLYFKNLLRSDGTLKPPAEIRQLVQDAVGTTEGPIIAYCTGGVRSGWMVAALRYAGFDDVRNYAGSMWDWAAAPATSYPLVRD